MAQREKNRIAAAPAVAGTAAGPYTRTRHEAEPMTGPGGSANLTLDRKLTDGLNLVHGEIVVLREDIRENRRESREARDADRREAREAREAERREAREAREADRRETQAGFAKLEARIEARADALRKEMAAAFDALRKEMAARFRGVEDSIQRLAVLTGRSLERGSWIRRLAWGFGGLALLLVGALARPLGERVIAAFLGD